MGSGNEKRTRRSFFLASQTWLSAAAEFGAGNETRTRDPDLGKVVLYQRSYSRLGVALTNFGAGNETRTRDPDLGKVVLYQLSYSRNQICCRNERNFSSLREAHYTRIRNLCNPPQWDFFRFWFKCRLIRHFARFYIKTARRLGRRVIIAE